MSSTPTESTQPPNQPDPILLKYIALPTPLPPLPTNPITRTVTRDTIAPCRRCLQDAALGETVHLIAYDPFPADSVSPYRGAGPIYVHAHECGLFDGNVLPERQLNRLLSVRAYDEAHMMVAAEVVQGGEFEGVVGGMLADGKAEYVNVHNAKPGCFAVRVERA